MPAIQTYEAKAIRPGYRAYRGEHHGTVLGHIPDPPYGTVSLHVDCELCGQPEQWLGIPGHSAMHAEPAQR
jgi:hypothetical protein